MELVIYVHDFQLEVGHSNAMIEIIRNSNLNKISKLEIVSYTCSDGEKILPGFGKLISHQKVPFSWISPPLFRSIFYHIWSYIYFFHKKAKSPNSKHISVGAASLVSDLVNIQFVHAQWNPRGVLPLADLRREDGDSRGRT